ncbi:MAG: diguanylate cyclase [Firmicutes bacterium]|nr:diguanylate cyclase [Bacillota bacterium]
MGSSFATLYLITICIATIIDFVVAVKAYERDNELGHKLGHTFGFSALVSMSYVAIILCESYFGFSVWSSAYYITTYWMMTLMYSYAVTFTRTKAKAAHIGIKVAYVCAIINTIIFLINPSKEIALKYVYINGAVVNYIHEVLPFYTFHFVTVFGLVAAVVGLCIYRATKVPREYRPQYIGVGVTVFIIAIVNMLFQFSPGLVLVAEVDTSVLLYSAATIVTYWFTFHYTKKIMLQGLSMTAFENINQGMILFDYDGYIVLKNSKAERMFRESVEFSENLTMEEFCKSTNICIDNFKTGKPVSIQCYATEGENKISIRCDYNLMGKVKDQPEGHIMVFTELERDQDLLTEFHSWEMFREKVERTDNEFYYPLGVVAFDINNLSTINKDQGRRAGDKMLAELAEVIRESITKDSYFLRHEACLIAICYNADEEYVEACAQVVLENYDGEVQYAIDSTNKEKPDIMAAIDGAEKTLRTKKLLDNSSHRAQNLASLVSALKESDQDTEAHVKRTQAMGREVGLRLGLTDAQQTNLQLLCLLHDIGKIGIPLDILNYPGKLTDEQWVVMKTHTEKGYQIAMSSREFSHIAEDIRCHHERWDGKGYPHGLAGEDIPLLSRIISVVDAYDAMVSNRPYRKGMPVDEALKELERNAGTQFDPNIIDVFVRMIRVKNLRSNSAAEVVPAPAPTPMQTTITEETLAQAAVGFSTEDVSNTHAINFTKYILNGAHDIIKTDEGFERITGYTQEDIGTLVKNQSDLIPEEDKKEYYSLVEEGLTKGNMAYLEHRILCKSGEVIYVFCMGRVFYDSAANEERVEIMMCKATETHTVKTVAAMATRNARRRVLTRGDDHRRDSLTRLLTKDAFRTTVERELAGDKSKVLFMIMDVDEFEEFNRTYGTEAGNDKLVYIAETIRGSLREEDIACRLSGDSFACALFMAPDVDDRIMYKRAHQIFERISMGMSLGDKPVSLSMGATMSGKADDKPIVKIRAEQQSTAPQPVSDTSTYEGLCERATCLLRDSKERGKSRITFGK